jgi:LmbE family N-acetylglucosaminyl deacetylase
MHRFLLCSAGALLAATPVAAEDGPGLPAVATGPALYVFAHQDDEIFILGKMWAEVRQGREVHAIWITDGAKAVRPGHAWEREKESRSVMERIGVPQDRLHFLGFPDTESFKHLAAVLDRVMGIADSRPFAEATSPAYEGGNIDHDAAAFVVAQVAAESRSRPVHWEFPLYNYYQDRRQIGIFLPHPQTEIHFFPLDKDLQRFVHEILAHSYHTQWLLLKAMEVAGHEKALLKQGEPFRRAPQYDFLKPPVDGRPGYEISGRHRASFAEWSRAVTDFRVGETVAATAPAAP